MLRELIEGGIEMASSGDGQPVGRASMGKALELAFGTMRSNPLVTFGTTFVLSAVPGILLQYFLISPVQLTDVTQGRASMVGYVTVAVAGYCVTMFLGLLVQTVLVRATVLHAQGERAGFADSLADGISVVLPLLGLFILMILGLTVGFVLLIVPGIMLYVMWYVAVPALVAERQGVFAAFSRSRYLTKGARWRIFGLIVLILIISSVLGGIAGVTMVAGGDLTSMAQGLAQGRMPTGFLIVTTLVSTVTGTVMATVTAAVYVQLRNWKDGPDGGRLEDIFA
jgi:uncharacterized membrane protein